jgi:hypothetical protein
MRAAPADGPGVAPMIRALLALGMALLLVACGGGSGPGPISGGTGGSGGSGGGTGGGGSGGLASNAVAVTVDGGPVSGVIQQNVLYVSVTLCAPGTTTCQTIDHVIVDTGSVGLRIFGSVLNASLLSALPHQADTSGNPVGECYAYVDGYVFGSVRAADFTISGESVSSMPLQILADSGVYSTPPASCSAGGGTNLNTVALFGGNGIIGIGVTGTDCGALCATAGGFGAATYYDCPSSGCVSIIARSASTTAPFQQLPNPVAAVSVDNNGSLIVLPSVPSAGETSLTGTLYFGIGTQSNNALPSATILTTTDSTNVLGAGLLTATYDGQSLNESFIDSGSSEYFFVDPNIPQCAGTGYSGQYCPTSPMTLTPTLVGANAASVVDLFTLYNAETAFPASYAAVPGLGGDTDVIFGADAYPNSFDFGLPFFYGRSVFTAIEGRSAAGVAGPWVAF